MIIHKKNRQELYNLTQEQRETLKEYLTRDNPSYISAKRYGKCRYTKIPPYLTYYSEFSVSDNGVRHKVLSVPIGVDCESILKTKAEKVLDFRKNDSTNINYPKFLLDLREDQIKAKNAYLEEQHKTYPKCMIQLQTGKGKTITALNIASTLKQKALVLVHKDDLVVGWQEDIKLCFGENIEIGLIKAKKRKIGREITIATVQTLNRMSSEELSQYTDKFGVVIFDEMHHIGLNMFNVIDKFNALYKIGLTATPKRSDGLEYAFDLFLGGLCYKNVLSKNDKDINRVKVIIKSSKAKYRPFLFENMVYNYYDYDPKSLPDNIEFLEDIPYKERPRIPHFNIDNSVVLNRHYKIQVCKDILNEYRQGHSCLVLFTQKDHIDNYYRYLSRYIPPHQIMKYYGDNKEKFSVLRKKAESREVLVTLATYAKSTEGTNVKAWEVEFLVSSINNEKNTEQAVGRIRRSKEGKINPVLVYDYRCEECYSLKNHINTRLSVYKELDFEVYDPQAPKPPQRSVFSRGYHRK